MIECILELHVGTMCQRALLLTKADVFRIEIDGGISEMEGNDWDPQKSGDKKQNVTSTDGLARLISSM